MTKSRLSFIDLVECIAILFVLLYHCTTYTFDFETDSTFINYLRYFSKTILSTCVPLFFFANGYLLLSRKFNLKKHIYRCLRLVILTFIWGVILVTFTMIINNEYLSIKDAISKVLFLEIGWTNLLWYMGALVSIYIFFPILKVTFDHHKKAFIFFTIVCSILTFGVTFINQIVDLMGVLTPIKIDYIWYPIIKNFNPFYNFRAYALGYFCIGGLAYLAQDKILAIPKLKRNLFASLVILISCIGLFLFGYIFSYHTEDGLWDVVWDGYDSIFTLINVLCIYVLTLSYSKDYKLFKTISSNTLGIYFTHELIIKSTKPTINSFEIFNNVFGNLVYSLLVLFVSLGIVLLIRKIPLLKKLV